MQLNVFPPSNMVSDVYSISPNPGSNKTSLENFGPGRLLEALLDFDYCGPSSLKAIDLFHCDLFTSAWLFNTD